MKEDDIKDIIAKSLPDFMDILKKKGVFIPEREADFVDEEYIADVIDAVYDMVKRFDH
jgi:hypothetical protein